MAYVYIIVCVHVYVSVCAWQMVAHICLIALAAKGLNFLLSESNQCCNNTVKRIVISHAKVQIKTGSQKIKQPANAIEMIACTGIFLWLLVVVNITYTVRVVEGYFKCKQSEKQVKKMYIHINKD